MTTAPMTRHESVWIDGTGTTTRKIGGAVVSITGPDGQPKTANKYGERVTSR